MTPTYDLMATRCSECLVTPERIVDGERAAEIVRQCRREDVKFLCHKAQLAGLENVACRGVHEVTGGCRAYRFALAYDIPVRLIDEADCDKAS